VGRRFRAAVRIAHLVVARARRLLRVRRHGAYRIDHVDGRRVFLAYADDPFAKEEEMWPHVARLRGAGAQGAVTFRLVFGPVDIVRWPLESGVGPVWPLEEP
jgi:hypothetical protein